jgi:hypothetical protein
MYFSLQIARALGFARLAVASQRGHAAWGCHMLLDWGQACGAVSVDLEAVMAAGARPRLERLRTARVPGWQPLPVVEHELAARTGRVRPPSFLLYPHIGYLRLNGERWIPAAPVQPSLRTWAERRR